MRRVHMFYSYMNLQFTCVSSTVFPSHIFLSHMHLHDEVPYTLGADSLSAWTLRIVYFL